MAYVNPVSQIPGPIVAPQPSPFLGVRCCECGMSTIVDRHVLSLHPADHHRCGWCVAHFALSQARANEERTLEKNLKPKSDNPSLNDEIVQSTENQSSVKPQDYPKDRRGSLGLERPAKKSAGS